MGLNLKENNSKKRWAIDLNGGGALPSSSSSTNSQNAISSNSSNSNIAPTGSNKLTQQQQQQQQMGEHSTQQSMTLKAKKGWELAKSPAKSIFMTGFFLWMVGNGINIFTMPIIIYAVINPIKAIFQTNKMFLRFDDLNEVLMMKLTYIAIQLVLLGITLYKCSSMGLLPITPSDWIYSLPIKTTKEFSSGSII
ncbi:DUF1077 family protein [Tieghemostelium lacteum]|uniref:ER membrane protein complex subunit 4 n=1 Tax=Tieghemostelium lacteum TaxID=361077 RepID=A0A151Z6G2_TIELA|nr:DUF1077 family protein [Tieghemostelium lacteum]|eukprot:KYQ89549.1 DUF1077 family protein [Tieghemostelium lacteum]